MADKKYGDVDWDDLSGSSDMATVVAALKELEAAFALKTATFPVDNSDIRELKTRVNTLDVQPNAGVQRQFNISFHCTHEPNTTSQRTYGFRHTVQHDGAWIVRNQAFTSPDNSGSARSVSTVTAMEIGA